jgi:hypothetical protein
LGGFFEVLLAMGGFEDMIVVRSVSCSSRLTAYPPFEHNLQNQLPLDTRGTSNQELWIRTS